MHGTIAKHFLRHAAENLRDLLQEPITIHNAPVGRGAFITAVNSESVS
jgi:hypothetical protein